MKLGARLEARIWDQAQNFLGQDPRSLLSGKRDHCRPILGKSAQLGPILGKSAQLGPILGKSAQLGPILGKSAQLGPNRTKPPIAALARSANGGITAE